MKSRVTNIASAIFCATALALMIALPDREPGAGGKMSAVGNTYDAFRFGIDLPEGVPTSIQVRAYASPVWYTSAS